MATACEFNAPNGQPSLLYRRLVPLVGENRAASLWEKVRTPEWQKQHGWWSNIVESRAEDQLFTGEKVAGPGEQSNLINPKAVYDVLDLNKPLPEKAQLLNQFGIKLYKNKAYYVPTAAELSRILAYNKKGNIGSTKLGFTLAGRELFHEVTYKVIDGKSYIFVDFSEFVESEGVKIPVITGHFRVEAVIVKGADIGTFKKSVDAGKAFEQGAEELELSKVPSKFSTKNVSTAKAVSFGKRMMNLQIIALSRQLLHENYDYDDLKFMDDEAYFYLIDRIIKQVGNDPKTIATRELRDVATKLIALKEEEGIYDYLPKDWESLLNALPETAKKLIEVRVVVSDNHTGQFDGSPTVNMQMYEFDGLGNQLLGSELMMGSATRLAFKAMLEEGLVTQEQLDLAQKSYASEYKMWADKLKKGENPGWKAKILKNIFEIALQTAKINKSSFYAAVQDSKNAIYDHLEQHDPRTATAIRMFSSLRQAISNIDASGRYLTSVISVSEQLDSKNIAENPEQAAFVAVSHEFGHAVDFYLNMTSKTKRHDILSFFEALVKAETLESVALNNRIQASLIKRHYDSENSYESLADLFSSLLLTLAFGNDSIKKVENTYISQIHEKLSKMLETKEAAEAFDKFLHQYYKPASKKAAKATTTEKVLGFFAQLFEDFKKYINELLQFPLFNISEPGIQTSAEQLEQISTMEKLLSIVFDAENFNIEKLVRSRTQGLNDSSPVMAFLVNDDPISEKSPDTRTAVESLFDKMPALKDVGTTSQYENYLQSIFPGSRHKNIVYRANSKGIATSGNKVGGLWFADSEEAVTNFAKEFGREEAPVAMAVVNMSNPKVYGSFWDDFVAEEGAVIERLLEHNDIVTVEKIAKGSTSMKNVLSAMLAAEGHDSFFIGDDTWNDGEYRSDGEQFVVFKDTQVHELGTEKDIEGFNAFVNGQAKLLDELDNQNPLNMQLQEQLAQYPAFRNEAAFLSNMTPFPAGQELVEDGITYKSVEHYYQAQKFVDPAMRQKIADTPDGYTAKAEARKHVTGRPKGEWETVSIDIMRKALEHKFSIPVFREQLLATGDLELVERNNWNDTFWGYTQGKKGQNNLGKLLMEIRKGLNAISEKPVTITPKMWLSMDFRDGDGTRAMQPQFAGKSTMDLVLSGDRTATTRKEQVVKDFKVGDILGFTEKRTKRKVFVRVTREPRLLVDIAPDEWAKREGWEPALHKDIMQRSGSYMQFEFELLDPSQQEVDPRKDTLKHLVATSGGAKGADKVWNDIGAVYGVTFRHFYIGTRDEKNAPFGNEEVLTNSLEYAEGRERAAWAAKATYGYPYGPMKDIRLIRNWSQVKNADEIFAVGAIAEPGERLFPNIPNDDRLAKKQAVTGGTGYAVEMAIQSNKKVHVFDQNLKKWFTWDKDVSRFVEEDTPVLTPRFAAIGTRQLQAEGIEAIHAVFEKTREAGVTIPEEAPTLELDPNGEPSLGTVIHAEKLKRTISTSVEELVITEEESEFDALRSSALVPGRLDVELNAFGRTETISAPNENYLALGLMLMQTPGIAENDEAMEVLLEEVQAAKLSLPALREAFEEFGTIDEETFEEKWPEFMRAATLYRAHTDIEFVDVLLSTGNREITFKDDPNRGRILMEIREFLLHGTIDPAQVPQHTMTMKSLSKDLYIELANPSIVITPRHLQASYDLIRGGVYKAFQKTDKYTKEELHSSIVGTVKASLSAFEKILELIRAGQTEHPQVIKAMRQAEASGLTIEEVIANLQLLFSKAKKPLFNRSATLLDHLVNEYVFDIYAEQFGLQREKVKVYEQVLGNDNLQDALSIATAGLKQDYYEDVFSLAPHQGATMRMKAILAGIPIYKTTYYPAKSVSISIPNDVLRNEIRRLADEGPYVTETSPMATFYQGKKRMLIIKPVEIADKIGLEPIGDKRYGRTTVGKGTESREVLITAIGKYSAKDFDLLKPVLVRERIIPESATSYDGDLTIYEVVEKYDKAPAQSVMLWNQFGSPSFANYEILYGKLSQLLHNAHNLVWEQGIPDTTSAYELMLGHPDIAVVKTAEKLMSAPEHVKKEFIKLMSQTQNNEFKMLFEQVYTAQDDGSIVVSYSTQIVRGDRNSTKQALTYRWKQRQETSGSMIPVGDGTMTFNAEIFNALRDKAFLLAQDPAKNTDAWRASAVNLTAETLEFFGIEMTPIMIDALFANYNRYVKGSQLSKGFTNIFSTNKKGQPIGVVSALLQPQGPFKDESSVLDILSNIYIEHDRYSYAQAYKNNEGKTVWPHGLANYVSRQVAEWNNGIIGEDLKGPDGTVTDRFHQHNPWVTDQGRMSQLSSTVFGFDGGISSRNSTQRGKGRSTMEHAEIEMNTMAGFFNQSRNTVMYYGPTNSDKKNVNIFQMQVDRKNLSVWSIKDGLLELGEKGKDIMVATFSMEYNRILQAEYDGDDIFYLLPQLNLSVLQSYVKQGLLPAAAVNALYDTEAGTIRTDIAWGKPHELDWKGNKELYIIRNLILPVIAQQMINHQRDAWRKLGIMTEPGEKTSFRIINSIPIVAAADLRSGNIKYILVRPDENLKAGSAFYRDSYGDEVLLNLGKKYDAVAIKKDLDEGKITKENFTQWASRFGIEPKVLYDNLDNGMYQVVAVTSVGTETLITDSKHTDLYLNSMMAAMHKVPSKALITEAMLMDYTMRTFEFNTQVATILSNDPALFTKYKAGKSIEENYKATIEHYVKRLAGMVAPGYSSAWLPGSKVNVITIKDPRTRNIELIEAGLEVNQKLIDTIGDAQELLTVEEWLDNLYNFGELEEGLYKEMKEVVLASKGKYYEFTDPAHLAVIRQPQKPVYFGKRRTSNITFTDYVKSSSVVLYPPEISGMALDTLRIAMETSKEDIRRAHFKSARKAGAPAGMLDLMDENTDVKAFTPEALSAAITNFDRKYLTIQQYVPYDATSDMLYIVTQANKNLIDAISELINAPVSLKHHPDKKLTGQELIDRKTDIIREYLQLQVNDTLKRFAGDKISPDVILNEIAERSKQSAGLTFVQQLSLTSKNSKGQLHIPFEYNPSFDRLQTLFMGMVNNPLKLYFPGTSFVQSTSAGMVRKDDGKYPPGLVFVGDYDGTKRLTSQRYVDNNGVNIINAQVIVPFSFTDSKGKKLSIQDYTKTIIDVNGNSKTILDPDKMDPQLLRMVGLRIPNQKHSSMIAFEIVGFLPPGAGKQAIVPGDITRQMGSDFDVDKLFTYRYNYAVNQLNGKLIVDNSTREKELQNDYVEIFETVLTAPQMYSSVMTSVDQPDLEMENKRYYNTNMRISPFENVYQNADYIAQKTGKDLIGVFAKLKTLDPLLQTLSMPLVKRIGTEDGGTEIIDVTIDVFAHEDGTPIIFDRIGGISGEETEYGYRRRGDNINVFLSESVDYANKRAFDGLNVNMSSVPSVSGALVVGNELGEMSHVAHITALLQQPIILEFSRRQSLVGTVLQGGRTDESIAMQLLEDLKYTAEDIQELRDSKKYYSVTQLRAMTKTKSLNSADQAYLLLRYLDFSEVGTAVRSMQAHTDMDVKGLGKTISEAYTTLDGLFKDIGNSVRPTISLDNRAALLGIPNYSGIHYMPMHDGGEVMTMREAMEMIYAEHADEVSEKGAYAIYAAKLFFSLADKILPLESMINTAGNVLRAGGMSIDNNPEGVESVFSFLRSWVTSYTNEGTSNPIWGSDITAARIQVSTPSMAKDLFELQTRYPNNLFLKNLSVDEVENRKMTDPVLLRYRNKQLTDSTEEQLYSDFIDLFTSTTDEQARSFMTKAVIAQFVFGGTQTSSSFTKYLHPQVFAQFGISKNYNDFATLLDRRSQLTTSIEDSTNPIDLALKTFNREFFQNNPQHSKQVWLHNLQVVTKKENGTAVFDVPYTAADQLGQDGVIAHYVHIKKGKDITLYERQFDAREEQVIRYKQIPLLGNRIAVETHTETSIFDGNRALFDVINMPNWGVPGTLPRNPLFDIRNSFNGGPKAATALVQTIIDNPAASPADKAVAELLLQFPITVSNMVEIQNTAENNGLLGQFDPATNVLGLNLKGIEELAGASIQTRPERVILHEYNHALIQQHVIPGLKTSLWHYQRLKEIRKRLSAAIDNPEFTAGFESTQILYWKNQLEDDAPIDEFVTEVMTSPAFMEFANRVPSEPSEISTTTLWEDILNLFSDMLAKVAESLGIEINDAGTLKEAFSILSEVLQLQNGSFQMDNFVFKGKAVQVVKKNGQAVGLFSPKKWWQQTTPEATRSYMEEIIADYNFQQQSPYDFSEAVEDDGNDIFGRPWYSLYQLTEKAMMSESQKAATDKMLLFADRVVKMSETSKIGLKNRSFLLSGPGGTGKTTILRKTLHELTVRNRWGSGDILFFTPTHTAKQELKAATSNTTRVNTVAKANGMSFNDATLETSVAVDYESPDMLKDIIAAKVIVIDEMSMVGGEDWDMLKQKLEMSEAIVIFSGDKYQLGPVLKGLTGSKLDKFYRGLPWVVENVTSDFQNAELTENMRSEFQDLTLAINGARQEAKTIHDGFAQGFENLKFSVRPEGPVTPTEHVHYTTSENALVNKFVETFADNYENLYGQTILTYRKATAARITASIRRLMFPEVFRPGGPALAVDEHIVQSSADILVDDNGNASPFVGIGTPKKVGYNSMRLRITEVGEPTVTVKKMYIKQGNFIVLAVPINIKVTPFTAIGDARLDLNRPGNFYYHQIGFRDEVETFTALRVFYNNLNSGRPVIPIPTSIFNNNHLELFEMNGLPVTEINGQATIENTEEARNFLIALRNFNSQYQTSFGYASNIHKAQGAGFDHVFVDDADVRTVMANKPADRDEANLAKARYTMYSRARKELTVLNPAFTIEKADPTVVTRVATAEFLTGNTVSEEKHSQAAEDLMSELDGTAPLNMKVYGTKVTRSGVKVQKEETTQRDRLISELLVQKKALEESLRSDPPPVGSTLNKSRMGRYMEKHRLEEYIRLLRKDPDLNLETVTQMMHKQLVWASNVLSQTTQHVQLFDIVRALEMTEMWHNYANIVEYDVDTADFVGLSLDEQREELAEVFSTSQYSISALIGKAGVMHNALRNKLANKLAGMATAQSDSGGNITGQQLLDGTKFSTWHPILVLTNVLSSSDNRLAAFADNIITQKQVAVRFDTAMADKELNQLRDEQAELEERLVQAGHESLWEVLTENAYKDLKGNLVKPWGLLSMRSPHYEQQDRLAYTMWSRSISILDKDRKLSPDAKDAKAKAIGAKYWKDKNKPNLYIDVERIWDFTRVSVNSSTGSRKSKAEIDTYKAELQALTHEDVDVLIEQALAKIVRFHEDLDAIESASASMAESEGLVSAVDIQAYTQNRITEFIQSHDPRLWLKGPTGAMTDIHFSPGRLDAYVVRTPKAADTALYSDKYIDLMYSTDPTLQRAYKWLQDYKAFITKMVKQYPPSVSNFRPEGFFPAINRDETRIQKVGPIDWARSTVARAVDDYSHPLSLPAKKLQYQVPMRHVANMNTIMPIDEANIYSQDFIRVAEIFAAHAIHYTHMASVSDLIMASDMLLREQRSSNDQIKQMGIQAWENKLARSVYKHPKKVASEGFGPTFRHSGRRFDSDRLEEEQVHSQRLIAINQLIADIDALPRREQIKRLKERSALKAEALQLQNQIDEIRIAMPERKLFSDSIIDKAIQIQQLKSFAFNPISGVLNLSMGWISGWVSASGDEDMAVEDFNFAMKSLLLLKSRFFGGDKRKAMARKMMALLYLTNMSGERRDVTLGFNVSNLEDYKTWLQKHRWADIYTFMTGGDQTLKAATLYAVAKKTKVELENGQTISLWDALSEDGTWDTAKHGKGIGYGDAVPGNEANRWTKYTQFATKVMGVLQPITGETDPASIILAKKWAAGRAVGQFRLSWIPEGTRHRWQGYKEYDERLRRAFKGRYQTAFDIGMWQHFKLMAQLMLPKMLQAANLMDNVTVETNEFELDASGNRTGKRVRKRLADSKVDMANTLRNAAGIKALIATMSIMYLGVWLAKKAFGLEDDDEDDKKVLRYMMLASNLLTRQYQDLVFYANPVEASTLLRGILPIMAVPQDAWKFWIDENITMMHNFATGEEQDWEKYFRRFTKNGIILPHLGPYSKYKSFITRDIGTYKGN